MKKELFLQTPQMWCDTYSVSVTASQKKQAGLGKMDLWVLEMLGSMPVHLVACACGLQKMVENVIFAPISNF